MDSFICFRTLQLEFAKYSNLIHHQFSAHPIYATLITVICAIVFVYLLRKFLQFKRICDIMSPIPGPPSHFLLGNAILVLYLDKFNFKYGTYVLLFQMGTAINQLFGQYKICKMWLGFKPFVILFTPEAVEAVLTNANLTIKADEYDFLKPWLGEGLVTSNGKKWRTRRKMLTQAFHFKILQDFLPIMNEHSGELIDKLYALSIENPKKSFKKLDKYLYGDHKFVDKPRPINYVEESKDDDKIYDIIPIITLCTLDIVCETAMGVHLNLQKEESDYVRCIQEVEKFFLWRLSRPWLWFDFVYKLTTDCKENIKCLQVMREFTYSVIDKRKKIWLNYLEQYAQNHENIENDENDNNNVNDRNKSIDNQTENKKTFYQTIGNSDGSNEQLNDDKKFQNFFTGTKTRLAFLDVLLQQHFKDPKNFTIDDVKEEADTFMFAGHDTTAFGISWTLFMLGRYPDIQQKVRDEIDEIIDNMSTDCTCKHKVNFNFEQLKEMKYLDCVLKEVQRIYPTAPFFGRRVTEDLPTNGYVIPKGSTVAIFTYAMHRNPKLYPNPLKFDPDRFLPENVATRHPYSFIPFSAGSRNCIGQKFSQLEQKIVLAKLVRNFYFESTAQEDQLVIVGEMILKSKSGLPVKIYRRWAKDLCNNCKNKEAIKFNNGEMNSRNL